MLCFVLICFACFLLSALQIDIFASYLCFSAPVVSSLPSLGSFPLLLCSFISAFSAASVQCCCFSVFLASVFLCFPASLLPCSFVCYCGFFLIASLLLLLDGDGDKNKSVSMSMSKKGKNSKKSKKNKKSKKSNTNQQPTTSNQQPTTNNHQPATTNHRPATNNHQVATNNQ